ncbi:MAG TPA: hypothetical protein VK841_01120 [Polyangiaceae bacterium]|nr:hypothetical protein [Polyangiaceae bacterium]
MKPLPFVRFVLEVLRLELSPAWHVLLTVAVDGTEPAELPAAEQEIARLLFGPVDEVPEDARRALVWRLGRASGKTTIAAALGVWLMLVARLDAVGPGMVPAVVTVAPSKPTAKLSVGVARELVRRVPSLERLVCEDGDTSEGFSLVRPDGRRVSFVAVAASRGGTTLRGYDLLALIIDEAEFLASNGEAAAGDGYVINDRDLYAAAKPRLHGPAIFISTPWPSENLTAELFDRNHGKPTTALAALGVSTVMRPDDERLARDVAQALASGDDDDARREYLCEPGARGGSRLFDPASIDAAIVEGRPLVIFAPEGASVGAGGDIGLERDSSAIAIVANAGGAFELLEFDEVRPTKTEPLAPGYVIRQRFAPILNRHGVSSITMDAFYRQSAAEHLDAMSLEFERAPEGAQGKYDSHMHVRSLLRTGKLKIPAVPRLIAQLRAVTSTPLPGGGTRITSPRRMGQAHGDIVSALVLACWAAREDNSAPSWATALEGWAKRGYRDAPAEEKPALVCLYHYTGMHEIYGNEPKFNMRMRAVFTHANDEGRFSSSATDAFRAAVAEYRRANNL